MNAVVIPDTLFAKAEHEAAASGVSISAYVAGLISNALSQESDNYDHLFTPVVIAELDGIAADLDAGGRTYSSDEVDRHFAERRTAWLAS